jgi:hypothetical protein
MLMDNRFIPSSELYNLYLKYVLILTEILPEVHEFKRSEIRSRGRLNVVCKHKVKSYGLKTIRVM